MRTLFHSEPNPGAMLFVRAPFDLPSGLTLDDEAWLARQLEIAGVEPRPIGGPEFLDPSTLLSGASLNAGWFVHGNPNDLRGFRILPAGDAA